MFALIGGKLLGFFATKFGMYLIVGAVITAIIAVVALRIFNMGKNAILVEVLNATLQETRRKLLVKKRQATAAATGPRSHADLERVFEEGAF